VRHVGQWVLRDARRTRLAPGRILAKKRRHWATWSLLRRDLVRFASSRSRRRGSPPIRAPEVLERRLSASGSRARFVH
jgi:hypothetical protein